MGYSASTSHPIAPNQRQTVLDIPYVLTSYAALSLAQVETHGRIIHTLRL
jgi:hypothetical protein